MLCKETIYLFNNIEFVYFPWGTIPEELFGDIRKRCEVMLSYKIFCCLFHGMDI